MIDITGDLYAEIENEARISYVRHKASSDGQQVSMWDFKEAHLANAGFKVGRRVATSRMEVVGWKYRRVGGRWCDSVYPIDAADWRRKLESEGKETRDVFMEIE